MRLIELASLAQKIYTFSTLSDLNIVFLSLMIHFVLENSAHPDEMPHTVAFHLRLHCLPWGTCLLVSSIQKIKCLPQTNHSHETKRSNTLQTQVKINTNFQRTMVNNFLPIIFSICFGCSKETSQFFLSTHNICFR